MVGGKIWSAGGLPRTDMLISARALIQAVGPRPILSNCQTRCSIALFQFQGSFDVR